MSAEILSSTESEHRRELTVGLLGVAVVVVILVAGLAWAKWLPYASKAHDLSASGAWSGSAIFDAAGRVGGTPSLSGAWTFTTTYFTAIWKALVVALLVAAGVDALIPRAWLLRALDRPGRLPQAVTGGLASLPSMMCTCCTAPVAVGLRRRGAPVTATAAYWLGNPVLNPAVLVFLALVLPWQFTATRIVVGLALVIGGAVLLGRLAPATAVPPRLDRDDAVTLAAMPVHYLRSLVRLLLILVPEYVVVVMACGLLSPWLDDFGGLARDLGFAAVVIVAVVATLLVIPTGGEIPVIVAVVAAGAGTGVAGAVLIALPAVSLPSLAMVARSLGWRVTAAAAGLVALAGVAGGVVLSVL